MAKWINIKDIAGSAKFYAGAAIRIMPVPRGLEEGNFIPEGGLVYLVSGNASDKSYFNCVCLSPGEEGNVIYHLERNANCVLGSEIKRMFESELQEAFISKRIKIAVN
ncbi:hypothetical protein [uncultured Campylobacter sp.]|uniref:hypothetical protein n=1 Tax=uncultured Campylobacter sp. TaxID=218934 RepID=UPI00262870CD|nr:hypothetical protein [uncultured Campylobacter sp.]